MSGTTTELGLGTAVDSDDTADYLTLTLASGLNTLDALFNSVTGHTHNGAHHGGPISFATLNADEIEFPNGAIIKEGTTTPEGIVLEADRVTTSADLRVQGALTVVGASALAATGITGALSVSGLSSLTTLNVSGNTNLANTGVTGALNVSGALVTGTLGVTGGVNIGGNVAITGGMGIGTTLTVTGQLNPTGGILDPKISGQVQIGGASATLPTPVGNAGLWRYVKAFGSNCTILLTSGTMYLGTTGYATGAYILNNGDSLSIYCDGTNWWVM